MPAPAIGDLIRDRQRLEIYCAGHECPRRGRPVILDPEDAVKLLGAETTFVAARSVLRCQECGAKGPTYINARASIGDYYDNLRAKGLTMPDASAKRGN